MDSLIEGNSSSTSTKLELLSYFQSSYALLPCKMSQDNLIQIAKDIKSVLVRRVQTVIKSGQQVKSPKANSPQAKSSQSHIKSYTVLLQ